jgi:hypothetical protein
MATKRNLVILGVGPNEFLVRADGNEDEVRAGITKMLADVPFELESISDKQAAALERRLSPPQHDLLKGVSRSVGVSVNKRIASHFVVRLVGNQGLTAAASSSGKVTFSPIIEQIRKPLPGGIGPVGVTVGIGIAGKF